MLKATLSFLPAGVLTLPLTPVEESIVLTEAKTGASNEFPLAARAAAKKRGLSTEAKIALIGIGAAVLGVFIFLKTCGNPDVCG